MTDRQLLEAINNQIGSINNRIESMSDQIGQLVHHVAEVRRTNVRLEADMAAMRDDICALDTKIEAKTDFLASKIDHFIDHFSVGQTRDRNRFEEERHFRSDAQRKTEQRLEDIEHRLERLEAASS